MAESQSESAPMAEEEEEDSQWEYEYHETETEVSELSPPKTTSLSLMAAARASMLLSIFPQLSTTVTLDQERRSQIYRLERSFSQPRRPEPKIMQPCQNHRNLKYQRQQRPWI